MHNKVQLSKHDWLRLPAGQKLHLQALIEGATMWIKTGSLLDIENQIKRVQSD